ncbi:serine hydrolase [Fictibacillus barbaricus]|uniref:CubicO group peptidase (Beta-lactamase class C family) n=1 Tax=Fictibacillus barbaricus TaxID=182136 RepID=A0ABU1TW86_9BACL|nr:serine hydrolase [Fictibacillus barbaricus]MDR7071479.1 CubicO group peptidase (beta-lactamase class C family) [Fictibacillus barbaricus]
MRGKRVIFSTMLSTAIAFSAVTPIIHAEDTSKHNAAHPGDWNRPSMPSSVLHPGTPESVSLNRTSLKAIDPFIEQEIEKRTMPGAVVLVARSGSIAKWDAYGYSTRYTDDQFTEMDNPVEMKKDTIFDIASISKLFTTTAAMQLYEKGLFNLDDPVGKYIPEFNENGKEKVTIRQIMTHTSGFTAWIPLYNMGTNREDRLQIALKNPLKNPPGTTYTYSDLNLITLGVLVERLTGKRLDAYVKENITEPLGMKDTMYNPPASLRSRIAATEYQPALGRGLVWGSVHDENSWSLDGVAGHAGVFSTAKDLAVFGQMILLKGTYGGKQILKPETVRLLTENQLPQFPSNSHGLGWELNQGWYMDALSSDLTLGHTGYTGTSMVVSPKNQMIVLTLTNRVHPSRNTVSTNATRRQVARLAADAISVPMHKRDKAWFSGYGDNLSNVLTFSVKPDQKSLSFKTWYSIENESDKGLVQVSADGENWNTLPDYFTGKDEEWMKKNIDLPDGTQYVRFLYQTDGSVNWRGWYVDDVFTTDSRGHKNKATVTDDQWGQRNW